MIVLGVKKTITTIFVNDQARGVSIIEIKDLVVADKYERYDHQILLLGIGRVKKPNQALAGRFKALKYAPVRTLECVVSPELYDKYQVGQPVTDLPAKGDVISVTGTSKGKGFAGVMKRWNFKGGKRTHGQSDRERAPGAIGAGTTPGRVVKGKRMAGRMGGDRVCIKNLKVMDLKEVEGSKYLLVKGSVPGARNSIVELKFELTKKNED